MERYTAEDVRRMLEKHCKKRGGQSRLAQDVGVSRAFVSQVLKGLARPSEKICAAVGVYEDGKRWVKR